ncbi:hypothetical protein [Endozoicomonas sp. ALD040]|uniref:hypothetical protein n=1 Tax=unclassified Endozoicomonas TaxID=2644528 RepID=UPI003BB21A60
MYHFRTGSQDRKFCIKKLSASSQEDITAMSGYFFIVFCPSDNGLDERVFMEASLSGAVGRLSKPGWPCVVFGGCLRPVVA